MKNELLVPPGVHDDKDAVELIRAWAAHGGLHCSINVLAWKEDEGISWGILLSDIARHVADALYTHKKIPREVLLAEIQRVFDEEIDAPTGPTHGGFVE